MKKAVLTGGTGFLGYWLLQELVARGVFVYVIQRRNSLRKERLNGIENIRIIELDMNEIQHLPDKIDDSCDVFYHLAWEGGRNDFYGQTKNICDTVNAVQAAKEIECKRIILTGSQAEYGLHTDRVTEDTPTEPNTAYGASKLAACHLTRILAEQLKIEWTWVRIFSLYGPYDNPNTLISYLLRELLASRSPTVTRADQIWDYLHVYDAAKAICILGESEKTNTVYNLANGRNAPLKEFINKIVNTVDTSITINYGGFKPEMPIVSLNASVDKITTDTVWRPSIDFSEGVNDLLRHLEEGY